MKSILRSAALAGALALTALAGGPANASVIQYDLTVDNCSSGCGLSNYGKILVSDIAGGGVHVVATLDPLVNFVKTGALSNYALVFSLTGGPNITIANLTTGDFSVGDSTGGAPNISAGGAFGSFMYGITCSACGPGASDPKHGPIAFDITNLAIDTSMFTDGIKTAGPHSIPTGIFFVVDIIGPNDGTGRIGTGAGHTPDENPPPDVPEPATLALFGIGLAGVSAYRRRNRR